MQTLKLQTCLFVFFLFAPTLRAQAVADFPKPDFVLSDVKHKEPKSGVHISGNSITIQTGVGTPTTINALSFSRNGKFLAAGKDFGRVVVWDLSTRKVLCAIDTEEGIVTAVALSSDGQLLATAGQSDQFKLRLWHLPEGKLLKAFDYFGGYLHSVDFSLDNNSITAWSNDGKIHVLDTNTGKEIHVFENMYAPLMLSNGQSLLAVTKSNFVVMGTSDWTRQRSFPRAQNYPMPLSLNEEGNTAVVNSSGKFRLMGLVDGNILPNIPKPELPLFNPSAGGFAAFSKGTTVLFGHSDDRLWAWDKESGRTCVSGMMYSESGALSQDGLLLAGAKDQSIFDQSKSDGSVWIWDTKALSQKCFGSLAQN